MRSAQRNILSIMMLSLFGLALSVEIANSCSSLLKGQDVEVELVVDLEEVDEDENENEGGFWPPLTGPFRSPKTFFQPNTNQIHFWGNDIHVKGLALFIVYRQLKLDC